MSEKDHKHAAWSLKVKNAIDYIDSRFREKISLSDVADAACMHKCSFCRLFRQATGMTFSQYLNRRRLELAEKLLLTSDTYIFHIAHEAGFRNPDYFRHLFRRRHSCSPTEYRDSHRNLRSEKR